MGGALDVENTVSKLEEFATMGRLSEEIGQHVVGGTVGDGHFVVGNLVGDKIVANDLRSEVLWDTV